MQPRAVLTFNNVTPEHYASLVDKAKSNGIPIAGENGEASKMGVRVSWAYFPKTGVLNMQVISWPFFLNAESVEDTIKNLVTSTT